MLVTKPGYLRLSEEQRLGVVEDTVPRLISDPKRQNAMKSC
jgi:hypothetical protein